MSYWDGGISFNNGRHRTQTLIDYGAEFVPFEMCARTKDDLLSAGVPIVASESVADFTKRFAAVTRYENGEIDPLIASSSGFLVRGTKVDTVIQTAQNHLRLLNYDLKATEQLKRIYEDFEPDDFPSFLQDRIKKQDKFLWYTDALSMALPALFSLQRQGITQWPLDSFLPFYKSGTIAEGAVRNLMEQLPVAVRLRSPSRGRKLGEQALS